MVMHKAIDTTNLTDQEIFDISLNHMRKQNRPSIDSEDIRCQYRYMDGETLLMCAAGPFVEDDQPNVCIAEVQINQGKMVGSYSLLRRLQIAHDIATRAAVVDHAATAAATKRMRQVSPEWKPEEWLLRVEAECRQIAVDFGLEYR